MGFFKKLWNAIKGGDKEELQKIRKEAAEKVADVASDAKEAMENLAEKASDVAKDVAEKAEAAKDEFNEKYGDKITEEGGRGKIRRCQRSSIRLCQGRGRKG